MKLDIGVPVITRNGRTVGEVHRVIVDVDDRAVTAIVVLKGHWLARDVLVLLDFIERAIPDEVVLRLDEVELDGTSGELDAFWVHAGTIFANDMRIPVEWIERVDDAGVHLAGTKLDIEVGLGPASRALSPRGAA